jgi:hypothetical protein
MWTAPRSPLSEICNDLILAQSMPSGAVHTNTVESLVEYENTLLTVALEARSMDCAIAFERANKGFLLSGERRFIDAAEAILFRLAEVAEEQRINDIERLRLEINTFLHQARNVVI